MSDSDAVTRLNAALEGRYAIERELGEGGMATVYLADDLKHERKVALKVLKPELAAVVGAERFLAEIKTTAHLQHPHILPLHDSGEADSFLYYVMPYVEGESLRERLDREHQLPVGEAVHIVTGVVSALDYAHRHGVIHRDIKPANILLHDGEPVVADFGIALAVGAAGGDRLTETGLSVGTPYYMSPEQATGDQHVGPPSDTYSVACVLYEMLVGEPPYPGRTAQAVLGKVIQGLPVSATAIRKSVPANVDAAIGRALEKLPADRFTDAQDFAKALADEGFRHGEVATTVAGEVVGRWKRMTMAFGVVAAVAMLAFGWALSRSQPGLVVRSSLTLAQGQELSAVGGQPIALSPDGSTLVYSGEFQLWQRPLSQLENEPIPGTEQGRNPVFSPDGASVAFTALGSLKTVSLLGGSPSTVVPSGVQLTGLDWASDGMLYFSSADGAIHRVPASGGESEPVTANDPGTRHAWVDALPDGRGLLFSIIRGASGPNEIAVIGFDDDIVRPLPAGVNARYSASGHIVFAAADGSLLGAPFDARRLMVTGPVVGLVDVVDASGGNVSGFALSEAGGMVYVPQGGGDTDVVPVWVERDGRVQEIDPTWRGRGNPTQSSLALSPDGTRLAISLGDLGGRYDLWVKQLDTGPALKLTSEGTFNRRASWSQDGQSLFFMSDRAGEFDLWTQRADGSSMAELVLSIDEQIYEAHYSSDGTWLVFRVEADNIYAIRSVDTVRVPLVETGFQDRYIAVSPDGRWLAYVSDDRGQEEVYVRPFPDATSALVPVSAAGGTEPVWSHSGRELFYRNGANEMMVAQVTLEPTFAVGRQEMLFSAADYLSANGHRQYDVSPDDQRFTMLRIGDEDVGAELVLVQNFFEELKRLVPN